MLMFNVSATSGSGFSTVHALHDNILISFIAMVMLPLPLIESVPPPVLYMDSINVVEITRFSAPVTRRNVIVPFELILLNGPSGFAGVSSAQEAKKKILAERNKNESV